MKREITIRLSIPNRSTIIFGLLVILGIYFLVFMMVTSYAETNKLPKRSLLNPGSWFESASAIPTPISQYPDWYPTTVPTNTNAPTKKPSPSPKPVTICPMPDTCKGQVLKITSGKCTDYICCQAPDGKYSPVTIAKCNQIQAQTETQQTNTQEAKFEQVIIPHLGKSYYCDTRYISGVLKGSNDFVDLRNNVLNGSYDLGSRWGAVCSMKPQSEQEQCLIDSGVYETAKKFDQILDEQEKKVMAVVNYACK